MRIVHGGHLGRPPDTKMTPHQRILAVYLLHLNVRESKILHQGGLAPEIIGVGVYLLVREDKIRLEAIT